MTREEAQVCFEYHLQVTVDPKIEWAEEGIHFISKIIEWYDNRMTKMQELKCSVMLEIDGRDRYTVGVYDLNYPEELEGFVQSKVKKNKNDTFRSLLSELFEQHKTKKAVNQIVNKEIDKIRYLAKIGKKN